MNLKRCALVTGLLMAALCVTVQAADLKLELPLKRTAYQTNEWIDLAVTRTAGPGSLELAVTGEDASRQVLTFAVTRAVEHLHLNAWLLRPGKYTVTATEAGASAKAEFEVFSHERHTSFKLINWGRAAGLELIGNGEKGFGFNLNYAHYGGGEGDNDIRAGTDFFPCCVMSGGHQMDLRMECDWSDPNVLAGARARVSRRALVERTKPNCLGIHFYDEPGLTWWNDPVSKVCTNASIPAQMRSFKSAFGYDVPYYKEFDRKNAGDVAKWKTFIRWKTGLMDSAWQDAAFGVKYVKPDFMTATQSQYGWNAFSDGYYFQITRNLSVTSGHGGYHDWGPGYWHPSFTMEVARARDFSKPTWYLPGWYGNTTSDQFRLEQYLSFQTNIQGMVSPPDLDPMKNPGGRGGITESNKLMGRLGTVFTTMPVTRGPVAILYSLSDLIDSNTQDPDKHFYAHVVPQGESIHIPYIATKLLQVNSQFVLEEDILDGTLQSNYKAVILNAINFLDQNIITSLERFITGGGQVYITNDSQVKIKGAIVLPVKSGYPAENIAKSEAMKPEVEKLKAAFEKMKADAEKAKADPKDAIPADVAAKIKDAEKALATVQGKASSLVYGLRASIQSAQIWAKALKPEFAKSNIKPVFVCSEEGISGTAQAQGDVEYLFAVNATHDFDSADTQLALKAVKATIAIPDDGRPVYDAIRGGAVADFKADAANKTLSGAFAFGQGSIRAFARTARPIGKVLVLKPVVTVDETLDKAPIKLDLRTLVLDNKGDALVGSFPLRVRIVDALGATRYDLYRATKDGVLDLSVTLAINDPTGAWKVVVTELLNNTVGTSSFDYKPSNVPGALAGMTPRAVYFGNDRENLKRFFRVNKKLTLVVGTNEFDVQAAKRFSDSAKPWGIQCTTVNAADVNKPEPDPKDQWLIDQYKEEFAKNKRPSTWCGPGGFDVPGPCVLIGNPEDNPLIKGIADQKVLPYVLAKDVMPGTGRGMIAWQLDSVRQGLESATVIAYDAAGMDEAIGCLYEAVAAQDPITPYLQPSSAVGAPATKAAIIAEPKVEWQLGLPDRADSIAVADGKITVVTHDGTVSVVDEKGALASQKAGTVPAPVAEVKAVVPEALKALAIPNLVLKAVVTEGNLTALAYWGGMLQIIDGNAVKVQQLMPQDITGMVWAKGKLVVGQADGQLLGLALP